MGRLTCIALLPSDLCSLPRRVRKVEDSGCSRQRRVFPVEEGHARAVRSTSLILGFPYLLLRLAFFDLSIQVERSTGRRPVRAYRRPWIDLLPRCRLHWSMLDLSFFAKMDVHRSSSVLVCAADILPRTLCSDRCRAIRQRKAPSRWPSSLWPIKLKPEYA